MKEYRATLRLLYDYPSLLSEGHSKIKLHAVLQKMNEMNFVYEFAQIRKK